MFVWDEKKRQANLIKHDLDFADADLVYDNPAKVTVISPREGEQRDADSAVSSSPETASPSSIPTEPQTSAAYPSNPPRDENENSLLTTESRTNWAKVRQAIAEDRHIPYDPNDDAAVEAYCKDALIVRGDGTILQQPTQSEPPAKSPQSVL